MKDMDKSFKKDTETEFPLREELRPHTVTAPDGQVIEIDPLQDYFCQEPPKVHRKSYVKIVEDFYNWARAHSLLDPRLRHRLRRDRDAAR